MIAVVRAEETLGHAADAGMRLERTHDLVQFELAIVVAVDHIARHVRDAPVHIAQDASLCYEVGRGGEYGAALYVVPVAMAINDVADRHARESPVELGLEPGREIGGERIDQDDALRRNQKQAVPDTVPCAI